jgi:nicotinamide-nucleotide amidase
VTHLLSPGGPDAVGVLLVGDELLLGTVTDVNGAWLARTLTAHGLRVVDVCVVPDDEERIVAALRRLAGSVSGVVVSGGIGPTSDDLTREALAQACGCDLVTDGQAAAAIEAWFAAQGRRAPAAVLRMARRPACATVLANPAGSAPGVSVEVAGCRVYAVPGVPAELRAMVTERVLPDLLARAGGAVPTATMSLEVALLGESAVAARLAGVEADVADDPTTDLAYLARPAHVSVRLSVRREPVQDAHARLAALVAAAESALGPDLVGRDGAGLAPVVLAALRRAGSSVATAESLSGGGVVAALTAVPGSSLSVRGGVVAYTSEVKADVLGVDRRLLEGSQAVHPDVAAAMAAGARRVLAADWAVATTGAAGPDPVGPHQPGEVYVAVTGPTTARVRSLRLPGARATVQRLAVAHALDLLRRCLLDLPEPSHAAVGALPPAGESAPD